jgi:ribosomal protein L18E
MQLKGYETEADGMRLREHAARLEANGKVQVAAFWRDMADRIDERNAQLAPLKAATVR